MCAQRGGTDGRNATTVTYTPSKRLWSNGATIDEDLDDNELVVTVVATDFASEGI